MAIRYEAGSDGLFIGRQGENLAREIEFDISGWAETFGEGTVHALHRRKDDPLPYPLNLTVADGKVVWTVTSADTAQTGCGECELRYVVGDVLVKSMIYKTFVAPSLEGEMQNPEALPDWITEVLAAGEAAKSIVIPEGAKCIKYVESLDKNNIKYLRDLETGFYFLYGIFQPYPGAHRTMYIYGTIPYFIGRTKNKSYIQKFGLSDDEIDYAEITDSTYEDKTIRLTELEALKNKVSEVNETSDDEHYPSAKAVYDALPKKEKFKRIETIILSAAATEIVRAETPDGTPYAFKAVLLEIGTSTAGKTGNLTVTAKDKEDGKNLCYEIVNNAVVDGIAVRTKFLAVRYGGIYFSASTEGNRNNYRNVNSGASSISLTDESIGYLQITGNIPNGTVITIYAIEE